jgi:hypothetical protein
MAERPLAVSINEYAPWLPPVSRGQKQTVEVFMKLFFILAFASDLSRAHRAQTQSAGKPDAGPFAPQSIGAQIDRQPTPASIKRAEKRAQAIFAVTLARAKRLDARGNRAGCTRALSAAKNMYNLQ